MRVPSLEFSRKSTSRALVQETVESIKKQIA
jgi:hypothetical protein